MTFAARITRTPRPFDHVRAADLMTQMPAFDPALQALVAGTAGSSPYLADLLAREKAMLDAIFADPEAVMAEELAAVRAASAADLPKRMRIAKRRVALLTGLADLAGVWTLEQVTGALTDLADTCVDSAMRALVGAEILRGKLPGQTVDDIATSGGMVSLAMGKMGAHELNYSSDIDLICLFDETRFTRDDYPDARAAFVRATRKMAQWLSDLTEDGYVFRTDLRLRPDASVTPVCIPMAGAEAYYEAEGRTWERAAYIKARPAGGDIAAGDKFVAGLRPFVWRKHLDFAAIQDAHDMRLRIRDHKGLHGALNLSGHNMKLGRGGIREIEFFTQTRQLIAGGRDPSLRVRGTVAGLAALAKAGWIKDDTARILTAHYRAHREVEHRIQMLHDTQTHDLPNNDEGFARIAALMDLSVLDLKAQLTDRIEEVHDLTEGFFAPGQARQAEPEDDFGQDTTARWLTYPALKSARAAEIFRRLKPDILRRLKEAAKPEEALAEFDGFLAGLPAGVQLFSLFDANPQLTRLIVDICATAPALARYLSRNAAVFDAVIGGRFFAAWPGVAGLQADLDKLLKQQGDYEKRLDAARRWTKEWHFRIGVHHLRGLINAAEAGGQYADLAEAAVTTLWPEVVTQFATKHGPMPGRGAALLGMGSLGAGRLNAASDLDLLVIYDAEGVDSSEGPRPLATRAYYARLTQALVTAITAPTAEGRLYEVDMRLRPSGRQGPVATSLTAFRDYQRTEAWTWEHLALTRARPLAGNPALCAEIEDFRQTLLREKAANPAIRKDVAEMRSRIAAAKSPQGEWDAKIGTGRLMELELAAQTATLLSGAAARSLPDQIAAGVAGGVLSVADGEALSRALTLLWELQAAGRLLTGGTIDLAALGAGGQAFVLRETGQPDPASLARATERVAEEVGRVFDRLLQE